MTEGSRKNWTATDLYCLELWKMIPTKTYISVNGEFHEVTTEKLWFLVVE